MIYSRNSTLFEPEETTQINSTAKNGRGTEGGLNAQESAIERDFDSTFDDSFVLRTKQSDSAAESGFESGNHTISFAEDDNKAPTGMKELIKREKEGWYGDNQDGTKNFFDFKILEKKVM